MEKAHGSIIKALRAQKKQASETSRDTSGPRYSLFLSFKSGMQTLTDTLTQVVSNSIRLNAKVKRIQQASDGNRWHVSLANGEMLNTELLCIALPAPHTAALIGDLSRPLTSKLNAIPYASSATVNLAFRREDIHTPHWMAWDLLCLLRKIYLSSDVLFSSVKFENRAPTDHVLLRAFVGEPISKKTETELIELCQTDLTPLLGLKNAPRFAVVSKHSQAMAQYQVGHQEVISSIEQFTSALPGLALAGNGLPWGRDSRLYSEWRGSSTFPLRYHYEDCPL